MEFKNKIFYERELMFEFPFWDAIWQWNDLRSWIRWGNDKWCLSLPFSLWKYFDFANFKALKPTHFCFWLTLLKQKTLLICIIYTITVSCSNQQEQYMIFVVKCWSLSLNSFNGWGQLYMLSQISNFPKKKMRLLILLFISKQRGIVVYI